MLVGKCAVYVGSDIPALTYEYRIYSNRRRGVNFIFHDPAAAFIRGRRLFGGGVYSITTLFSTNYRTLYCIFLLANSNESQESLKENSTQQQKSTVTSN